MAFFVRGGGGGRGFAVQERDMIRSIALANLSIKQKATGSVLLA